MSTYTLRGDQLDDIKEAEVSEVTIDENNRASGRVEFSGKWPEAVNLALSVAAHPDFPALVRKTITVQRDSPMLARITMTFEGVVPGNSEEPGIVTRYSLKGNVSAEPIERHPDFAGEDGFGGVATRGTKAPNAKGAVYDEAGKFLGFAVEKTPEEFYPDANRVKSGIRSYHMPGFIYEEDATYDKLAVQTIEVNMNNIGKIDSPPDSPVLPEVPSPRDWLLMGATVDEVGDGITFKRQWKLSGPRGWDRDIYEES